MCRSRVAQAEIAKDFAGWKGGARTTFVPRSPRLPTSRREIVVLLKDKPSVSMILGQATGLRYRDPDALALRVGTAILGHGFTGRLMGTVRDKEGLTYNIGAAVTEDSIADGAWDISASFAPSLLDKGLASTRRVLEPWWQDGRHRCGAVAPANKGSSAATWSAWRRRGGIASAILTAVQRGYDLELARRLSAR